VLISNDGGRTFTAFNHGFTHRRVATLLADRDDSSKVYAGVLHDKEFGGVFVSGDHGLTWQQMSSGLGGADVHVLRQLPTGELVAGTGRGLYRFSLKEYRGKAMQAVHKPATAKKRPRNVLEATVRDLEIAGSKWFAATGSGLYISADHGKTWHGGTVEGETEFIAVAVQATKVAAISRRALILSDDDGIHWRRATLPRQITVLSDVAIDDTERIFVASREGVYRSDDGEEWNDLRSLPINHVASIGFDRVTSRLIAVSANATRVFESSNSGQTWNAVDSGWQLRAAHPVAGSFLATTAFDGIVTPPAPPAALATAASSAAGGNR
jgi:ligand-binding sensor domain-containing protein